ncbi:hypothetical protein B0H14DRAFT_2489945 [Mycena olivaceomarginata]|nr:hypothetical protein B0H14DRAFT_2489945 [Mycena olivaceomarginata]
MKIYIVAIAGYVPSDMVKCLSAFMDFCYLVRRNAISTPDLTRIKSTLDRFHHFRTIFIETGVRDDISLPRQHALVHYVPSIKLFGSPNGLCSSITESKHIKAVKEPWRRSSRYKALPQMLVTISRLEKMAAVRRKFAQRGMMTGTTWFWRVISRRLMRPLPLQLLPPTMTTTTMGLYMGHAHYRILS